MAFLDSLEWLECRMTITCRNVGRARNHPLSIIDAIIKFASGTMEAPPLAIFHPLEPFGATAEGTSYSFDIILPHADREDAETLLQAIRTRLAHPQNHFSLDSVTDLRKESLAGLVDLWHSKHPVSPDELVLDFTSPLGRKHVGRENRLQVDAQDLLAMLLKRAARIYGEIPPEDEEAIVDAWSAAETSCAFLEYREYHHGSKSGSGTQYVHGLEGPMILKGVTPGMLPLLLLCSRMNVGSRLHQGQGAYHLTANGILGNALSSERAMRESADFLSRHGYDADSTDLVEQEACVQALAVPMNRIHRRLPPRESGAFVPTEKLLAALDDVDLESDALAALLPRADRPVLERLLSAPATSRVVGNLRVRIRTSRLAEDLRAEGIDAAFTDRGIEFPIGSDILAAFPDHGFKDVATDDIMTVEAVSEGDSKRFSLARTVHVIHPYASIGIEKETLVARSEKERIARIPFEQIDSVVLHGAASISTAFLRRCASKGIPVILCDTNGYCTGSFLPESPTFREKARNHLRAWDALGEDGLLAVAKTLIEAKVRSYACRTPAGLADPDELMKARDAAIDGLRQASDWQEVLGYEGCFAHLCNRLYNGCVLPEPFRSARREPGLKPDRWNALVDVASSLTYNRIGMELRAVGLDPHLGFLHRQNTRFETLTADLQELLRADIDRWLIRCVNTGFFREEHFSLQGERWMMTTQAMRLIALEWERFLQDAVVGQPCTPADVISRTVRSVAGAMLDQKPLGFYDGTGWIEVPGCIFPDSNAGGLVEPYLEVGAQPKWQ